MHARIDAALAPLLPGDTSAVLCLRLDRLRGTPFYTRYVAGRRIGALEELARTTGLDPRTNIWELVFTTNGRTRYVFIRGKFGGEFGLEPDFKMTGLVRGDYKGHYLISVGNSGVVYMNTGAAVAGQVDDLKRLVDSFDNPRRSAPEALLDLVDTLPGTPHFWAASLRPEALLQLTGITAGTPVARMANGVSQLTLWGNCGRDLELHVSAQGTNGRGAAGLRDGFQAALDRSPRSSLYDGVHCAADGRALRIDVQEPEALLDRFLAAAWPAGRLLER